MQRRHFNLAAGLVPALTLATSGSAIAQQDRGQYMIQRALYGSATQTFDVTPRLHLAALSRTDLKA